MKHPVWTPASDERRIGRMAVVISEAPTSARCDESVRSGGQAPRCD